MLLVDQVSVSFGGLTALDRVTLSIAEGEFCGIIGPNGAGKTTLFNAVSRLVPLSSGDIRLQGSSLRALSANEICKAGIARTFQHLGVFAGLTVEENIALGALGCRSPMALADVLRLPSARAWHAEALARAREMGALCGLLPCMRDTASSLPFGQQKRVEIARSLASEAKMLLLDEPAGGLSHREIEEFLELILRLKVALRLTVVMIEHHLGLVMKACDHVVVLNFGRTIADGTPVEVRGNADVVSAYVGEEH